MGLDRVEFVMAVEERFKIRIPDEEAVCLDTPRQVILCVANHLKKRGETRSYSTIAAIVHELVRDQIGVREGDYTDDSRFREDLGME